MPDEKQKQTPQRLDKLIASQTALSRSDVRKLIREGRVRVDGRPVYSADQKVQTDIAKVEVDGRLLLYEKYVYYMLHKPAGVLSSTKEPGRKTVVDLVEAKTGRRGLFPVGRLDKDTTGLLLLTDDGDFAHQVISPKNGIEKAYLARLDGPVAEETLRRFAEGVVLADGTPCRPARLRVIEEGKTPLAEVVVTEGKYHQVKRMFGAAGLGVMSLERVRIGELCLDEDLRPGDFRPLSEEEKIRVLLGKQDKSKNEE